MTVKELLEVTWLWGHLRVHKVIDQGHTEPLGYFAKAEMENFNDYIVRYIQPEGHEDLYIEIEEATK